MPQPCFPSPSSSSPSLSPLCHSPHSMWMQGKAPTSQNSKPGKVYYYLFIISGPSPRSCNPKPNRAFNLDLNIPKWQQHRTNTVVVFVSMFDNGSNDCCTVPKDCTWRNPIHANTVLSLLAQTKALSECWLPSRGTAVLGWVRQTFGFTTNSLSEASLNRVSPEADLALRRDALERSSCKRISRSCLHLRHSCSRMSRLTAGLGRTAGRGGWGPERSSKPDQQRHTTLWLG